MIKIPLKLDITPFINFIKTPTPPQWLAYASQHLDLLMIDHAHCERKAATTAINFINKYPENKGIIRVMSPLAREELLHFEKVIELMKKRGLDLQSLPPSLYGSSLHKLVTNQNHQSRLRDQLIIGAIIEARSCERFYALMNYLNDEELIRFYQSLVKSEARHFEDYLALAYEYGTDVEERVLEFVTVENTLITQKDPIFRFHSGIPA